MIVIDDHNLLAVLAGAADDDLQAMVDAGEVFTTSSWYYRLARAVRDTEFAGALSARLGELPEDVRGQVMQSLDDLPSNIGLLSARVVVPVMAALGGVGRFNLLNAEALAGCLVLEADLRVVAAAPMLRSACDDLGIALEVGSV